jgi:hypothetical protein
MDATGAAPRYTAPMETPIITAILAAGWARKPRRCPRAVHKREGGGGLKNRSDNYVAQGAKKRAGAAVGNRHAARGKAERVDRHARLDALVQQVSDLAGIVNIAATIARLERHRLEELWRGCIAGRESTGTVHAN